MKDINKIISKIAILGFLLSFGALGTTIIAIIGYREEWWRYTRALTLAGWGTFIAIMALLILLYAIIKILQNNNTKGILISILGLILIIPILFGAFMFKYKSSKYPKINDVTTNIENPPSFWEMPNPMEYPKDKFAKLQKSGYPDLKSLKLKQPIKNVFQKVLKIVKINRWELISEDIEEGQIEAISTSLLFGFKDEIVIRMKKKDDITIVDIRSRSRIGQIDRGVNARRIRSLIKALQK
jgi:hypothetical protein